MTVPAFGWFLLPIVSGATALGILWIYGLLIGRQGRQARVSPQQDKSAHFLFQNGVLMDHDLPERLLPQNLSDWSSLRDWFCDRFPEFPNDVALVPAGDGLLLKSVIPGDQAMLDIALIGPVCRITLRDPTVPSPAERHDNLRLSARLENWNTALRHAPFGLSISSMDGRVIWQNLAFSNLPEDERARLLPDRKIVPECEGSLIDRISFKNAADGATQWYEVNSTRVGGDLFHYVTDITKVIQAETVRREFVQTLTKTFANLTTGLAVFDRQQRLALFNPAFVDLTGLSAEFLSARPDLIGVFDNLRDRQIMPEPKNYANWRTRISEIVATASDGLYQDTWSLPSGLTYRVTGRPHPDGAVAFLFEDISDEIALTRRFRTQLNLRQAVLDQLPDAIAVISPNNLLLLCNKRCSDVLGIDPDSSLAELSVPALIAICREHIPDDTFWPQAETLLSGHNLTEPLETVLYSRAGHPMRCRLSPLTGGSAMLSMADCTATVPIDTSCQAAG
ncbi:hypothetical protein RAZWK3B_02685 [Roseobacter sp. AzwK-3b]|uniref:PAS-domain containing protein n=1 Tax=Roseobacter sp. AzwK-3b TaxID=351016 RepID=UPI0001569A7C|nr:PAS-domain containing protein [Roseobacter sp. AzwK-3b]EDM73091.1 hypothetical protein RAZWK3B_02685 [Roseobacter sp. AzwK-3b]